MSKYDLLITGGRVLDPANDLDEVCDIAISDGYIEKVQKEIDPSFGKSVEDWTGNWIIPGFIDTHVHVGGPRSTWDPALGHQMLALAGTTTAIDFGCIPEQIPDGLLRKGAGLNFGGIMVAIPETTIPNDHPTHDQTRHIVSDVLKRGALGIKITGGYYPFSPEITSRIFSVCNEFRAYAGYHVGTKETGSRLDGLQEVPSIIGNGRLHVAHINAYCRGSILEPDEECKQALSLLSQYEDQLVSEVHQAIPNGTQGLCDKNGEVLSDVAKNCLKLKNYEMTADGIRQAIKDGYCSVMKQTGDTVGYIKGEDALNMFEELDTNCPLSFPVNLPSSAFNLTTAKKPDGNFIVDAVATDGGSIPRNIAIDSTMALVKFGALSPLEVAIKLSYNPSKMIGLKDRGHLSEGARADITVIDPQMGKAVASYVDGDPLLKDGNILKNGGRWLVTKTGEQEAITSGLDYEILDFNSSKLYSGYKD